MMLTGTVPRRCVNLPPGALRLLLHTAAAGKLREGAAVDEFAARFGQWLGVPHVFGVSSGRSAFQLTLESLDLERGKEIIFPAFTFPVIPMVARLLGYKPVFCDVDPESFNAGAEHIEAKITENTGAVLATHMFGRPCPIREIAELVKSRGIRLLEDCAHACGVRVNSRPAGTFGDVGIYSFAEGKNMPCFGGGAIATADEQIARRARSILDRSPLAEAGAIASQAFSIWVKWLLTRPFIFGITAYPVLRARLAMGKPLMDSTVGDALLDEFSASKPRIGRMTNLQAALGLLQLRYIDAFNDGARENARILTENLGEVPSVRVPRGSMDDHVYVYYPLSVDPEKRDDLRRFLLRHGVDSKNTDMSDCTKLRAFQDGGELSPEPGARLDASVLEICVYPIIPKREMKRIARLIRSWAGLPEIHLGGGRS
jgi:dTDP-4-amino-4,6-dideoxygalactose transaminase